MTVPDPVQAETTHEQALALTREEIGLAIDGVARLVQSPDAPAAPLLRKLQAAYAAVSPSDAGEDEA